MKVFSRILAVFLALSLILGLSACAGRTGTADAEEPPIQSENPTELFLALTERTSHSMTFSLTEDQAARVKKAGADKVTWTLHRIASYGDPADGKFIPVHGEEKMFPNEKETIDFATITYGEIYESEPPFAMERFKTTLDGTTLKLDFATSPIIYMGNEGMPHESSGRFMDICGQFTLTAELDGEGDDDSATPEPYVEYGVMGQSYLSYDMPYLI